MSTLETRRGRPRKFAGPSRAVTLTLPEQVIETLTASDPDLGRAIARLASSPRAHRRAVAAELTPFGRHAVIVVTPTRTLETRADVELVPLPDGRALIAFPQSTTTADLELRLEDALEDRHLAGADRVIFEAILGLIRDARRSDDVALVPRSIIVIEKKRRPAHKRRTG